MEKFLTFNIFEYIIYYIFISIFIYLIGNIFLFNQKHSSIKQIFYKLLTGFTIILLLTSIIETRFKTVFILLVIPLFFLIRNRKIKIGFYFDIQKAKEISYILILSIPVLFLQFLFYGKLNTLIFLPIDMNNHAELSFFLSKGFETKFGHLKCLNYQNVPYVTPYHYSEIWINIFITKVLHNINIGYNLIFITYPLLILTYLSGLIALGKDFLKNKYITFLFCVLCLFVGPLDIQFFRELFDTNNLLNTKTVIFENIGFYFNTLIFSYHGQKHIPFYLISILFLIKYKENKINEGLIILSTASIINIGLLPSILGCAILAVIFHKKIFKKYDLNLKYVILIIISSICVFIFYKLLGSFDSEKQSTLLFLDKSLNYKGIITKTTLRLILTILFILIIYFPFLTLINFKKQKESTIFKIISLGLIAGISTRLLLDGFNTGQFLSYFFPILNIGIIYLLFNNLKTKKLLVLIILILVILINFSRTFYHTTTRRNIDVYSKHSKDFVLKVTNTMKYNDNCNIGYLLNNRTVKTIQPGFWYPNYPCEFLFLENHFNYYSLNYPNYEYGKSSTNSNLFYQNHLIYQLGKLIDHDTYEKKLFSIIKKNRIRYIVTQDSVLLNKDLKKVILDSLVDKKSNQKMYTIKIK
jgi:hypothetical protein